MLLEIVKKRQSIYILLVSLAIAVLSFLTIHGISTSVSNFTDSSPNTQTELQDTTDKPSREDLKDSQESLKSAIIKQTTTEQPGAAAVNCQVKGCNNELCIDVNQTDPLPNQLSSCSSTEANKCYVGATCAVQAGGKCGWSVNATINRCLADSNFATQTTRVIQIKFISDPNDIPHDPDSLSSELRNYIQDASTFHKYKDTLSKPAVNVEIVENLTVNHAMTNVENYWYGGYYQMIQEMGLCQKIKDEKIDQVWMWVDPRDGTASPGLEYSISSKFSLKNNGDGSNAKPPFCNGEVSFAIMGFDYTRTSDLALHSFGHYMESMVSIVENPDLLSKYEGDFDSGIQGRYQCGDVHFPPNGTTDYDYANSTAKPTYCENWDPNLDQNSAVLQSYNCSRWGCSQQGYLTWWMQNMPNFNSPLTYQGRKIPSWWDFTVGFDEKIKKYNLDTSFYADNNAYNLNNVDLNSNCSCNTLDQFGQPITLNQCWQSIYGAGATTCYQCVKDTMYQVPMFFCDN